MDPLLKLVAPSSHDIYFNSNGESFSRPLSGTAVVTSESESNLAGLTEFRLCLVRVISTKNRDSGDQDKTPLCWLSRQLLARTSSATTKENRSCSIVEEVTHPIPCLADRQIGNCPGEGKDFGIPFSIPIPVNIPGTAKTDLGTVSYDLVAFARTSEGKTISTSQAIHLARHVIPEQGDIHHLRTYPNSTLITKIDLTQKVTLDSASKVSFDAKVFLRKPMSPGGRSTEFRCNAARELRWRVEEVTKLVNEPSDENPEVPNPADDRFFVRELCNGSQRGYWSTTKNPMVRERPTPEQNDPSVDIAFDLTIPKTAKPTHEVDMCCYSFDSSRLVPDSLPSSLLGCYSSTTQEKLVLIVEHRLKLDVITGEDTFDARTRDLVDRKPLRTALHASFPLRIVDWARTGFQDTAIQGNPPRYEDVPVAPPNYPVFT